MYLDAVQNAWERRQGLLARLQAQGTDAFRLLAGDAERAPGLVVECFGPVAILQVHEGRYAGGQPDLKAVAQWCGDTLGSLHVYVKHFAQDRSFLGPQGQLRDPTPLFGVPAPAEVVVSENGLRFFVRPYDGFSVGLFLDQRENRQCVAQGLKSGARVLNLFAYTCAFSVYCAQSAAQTTSVDVSRKVLEWGKRNFAANALELGGHRFFPTDARQFLKTAAKRGERYDRIVLDPPSFARGKDGKPFAVHKDLAAVLGQCWQVLEPGGDLFVSANYSKWMQKDLASLVDKSTGPHEVLELPALPEDFPSGNSLLTYRWVRKR